MTQPLPCSPASFGVDAHEPENAQPRIVIMPGGWFESDRGLALGQSSS